MGDSGAILCQISSFKEMLDQVNEEIEESIRRTREVESEIVKCTEIEKAYLIRESELSKLNSVGDFEINGLIQVSDTTKSSQELMEEELRCLKMILHDRVKSISTKREKFIVSCKKFQRVIVTGQSEDLSALLSELEALENEKSNLNMKVSALRNSTREFLEATLEELHNSTSALQVHVQRRDLENKQLLKDIEELKVLLLSMRSLQDCTR